MKGEGLLKAATETLAATVERIERDREADRRTVSAQLHQVEEAIERLWEIVAVKAEITQALSNSKTGRLLKVRKMAQAVDMHPKTLQNMARAGEVPAYRIGPLDDWLFDPDEVIRALKQIERSYPTDLYGCDRLRDEAIEDEHRRLLAQEMERGI